MSGLLSTTESGRGSHSQVRGDNWRWRRRRQQSTVGRCCHCCCPVVGRGRVFVDQHRRVTGPSWSPCRAPTAAGDSAAADGPVDREPRKTGHHAGGEDVAEARVEDGIDGEVDGRVGDNEHVADAAVVELEAAAVTRRVIEDVPEDLVEERWRLADAEYNHHDDQHQCHVVVLRLAYALQHTRQT